MPNQYPIDVRREARRLWLTGRFGDEEIAAKLGIPRADTVRDWRHEEGWAALARDISEVIEDEVKAKIRNDRGAFDTKYDQLAQVIEGRAVRALSAPGLSPRDLKAIAGTLAIAQRIRDKALGGAAGQAEDQFVTNLADLIARDEARRNQVETDDALRRCRTGAGSSPSGDDPPPPCEGGDTATRGG